MNRILLTTLLVCLAAVTFSQNFTNKQMALIHYDLKISETFREEVRPLSNYLQSVEVHNEEARDRLKAVLIHHLYYNLAPRIERQLDISILPINSFMEAVKYDEYGYPKAGISRALRKGDSPFYFKLEVSLESQTEEKKESNPEIPDSVTFPFFSIDITIFNDEGIIPADKWHGEAAAEEGLALEKSLFGEFTRQRPALGATTLSSLYDQAIANLINRHLND
jgi:hypothetical protein